MYYFLWSSFFFSLCHILNRCGNIIVYWYSWGIACNNGQWHLISELETGYTNQTAPKRNGISVSKELTSSSFNNVSRSVLLFIRSFRVMLQLLFCSESTFKYTAIKMLAEEENSRWTVYHASGCTLVLAWQSLKGLPIDTQRYFWRFSIYTFAYKGCLRFHEKWIYSVIFQCMIPESFERVMVIYKSVVLHS